MVFRTSGNPALGLQSFNAADVDTVQKCAIGTIMRGFDPVLGEGEFIYLPGAGSVQAGTVVAYDLLPGTPTVTPLATNTVNNSARPVAFAVVAVPAGSFGWYQIGGVTIANVIGGTAAGSCFLTSTLGSVSNTADAGDQVLGARISSAIGTPAAGKSYVTISRPCVQSQIT